MWYSPATPLPSGTMPVCIITWTGGPQLRMAVVTVTFIVTLIVTKVTEGKEQHMWAHSEKSIVAESMGTGVVPWLWLWDLALYGMGGSG